MFSKCINTFLSGCNTFAPYGLLSKLQHRPASFCSFSRHTVICIAAVYIYIYFLFLFHRVCLWKHCIIIRTIVQSGITQRGLCGPRQRKRQDKKKRCRRFWHVDYWFAFFRNHFEHHSFWLAFDSMIDSLSHFEITLKPQFARHSCLLTATKLLLFVRTRCHCRSDWETI